MNIMEIIEDFKKDCSCGKKHETAVKDVLIESGAVLRVGEVLKRNNFCQNILLVADENTLKASDGIIKSLDGFEIDYKIYKDLRVATMEQVDEIEALINNKEISVLSVGTGSVNDVCRLACARQNKKLCIFATAPSMDGFASFGAPIVNKGFKSTYPAKSPEVIIADTKILANAPAELKSAGFGDMIAKYIGLVDWKISTLLTNEYYCEKIANLTRSAVDELMLLADKVCLNNEYVAGKIFEALLKTGIGMSFAKNSRPASGSEHMIAHLMECIELREDIVPNFHGDDVGVCTLEMLKYYNELAEMECIETQNEVVEWNDVYLFYGEMADEVKKINMPDNVIDDVDKEKLKNRWSDIRKIIHSVPTYEECATAMEKAGCKMSVDDIGKDKKFFAKCVKYSPYMRKRLTLLRLRDMIICF